MKCVVLYRHVPEVRVAVCNILRQIISQGANLEQQSFNHPHFACRPSWPSSQELLNLPINTQCEELEIVNGNISSCRMLVIEAEILPNPDYIQLDLNI